MAHVVDFTLFYGGVASAPVADLPFAGCSFDVQEGTARRAVLGEPEFESVAIAEGVGAVGREPVIGTATVLNAVTLDMRSAGASVAAFGTFVATTAVDLGGLSAGARTAAMGAPEVRTTWTAQPAAVPEREPAIGELTAEIAATVTLDGFAYEADFGATEWLTTARVDAGTVPDVEPVMGDTVFYSAVTLDLGGYAHSAPAAGKVDAYSTALVQPAGLTRLASVGRPSIAIDVFPSSVEYEAAFGAVTAHVTALAEPVSLPDTAPALGAAEFYSAVTLDFGSVVTAAPVAGQMAVTTAADVELDGFTHEAMLGRPGIAIDVFPASVERVPMVGSANFASVRDVALVSVPDTPAQVSGAAFESVAFVRFAGLDAGSAAMGGGVDVDTEALIRPAGILRTTAFGELGISVVIQPDSLEHESAIGGAYLIPAHMAGMSSVVRDAAFGQPELRIRLQVEPESVPAKDRAFGMPEWTWRKCPRHDRRAVLWQAHELEGRIRPAPKKVQEWKGTASVKRAQEADAVVCLAVEQRTVARRKNTTTAAIRREERI